MRIFIYFIMLAGILCLIACRNHNQASTDQPSKLTLKNLIVINGASPADKLFDNDPETVWLAEQGYGPGVALILEFDSGVYISQLVAVSPKDETLAKPVDMMLTINNQLYGTIQADQIVNLNTEVEYLELIVCSTSDCKTLPNNTGHPEAYFELGRFPETRTLGIADLNLQCKGKTCRIQPPAISKKKLTLRENYAQVLKKLHGNYYHYTSHNNQEEIAFSLSRNGLVSWWERNREKMIAGHGTWTLSASPGNNLLTLALCTHEKTPPSTNPDSDSTRILLELEDQNIRLNNTGKLLPLHLSDDALVELSSLSEQFEYDIRYATENNFTKEKLYDCESCMLRYKVALALLRASESFHADGYRIKLFDCYRPLSVQRRMWEILPNFVYVADPNTPGASMHNHGTAVDMTLVNLSDGSEVPMGTDFDHFGMEAWPTYILLPDSILQNRQYLKNRMDSLGFRNSRSEWWHFSLRGVSFPIADVPLHCKDDKQ